MIDREPSAEVPAVDRAGATARAGGQSPRGSILGRPITQIALVVPDLDAAMRTWWETLGIGPWHVYTLGAPTMTGMSYRGTESPFRIRLGLAFSGGTMLEIIEPLEGESIWKEGLLRGDGAAYHHVAIYVEEYEAAIREMVERGWRPVQTGSGFGRSRDGIFTYFEHDLGPGVLVEVVRGPSERFGPERIHPPEEAAPGPSSSPGSTA